MLKVREFLPDEWQTYRELRLRSLEESPDAFGRTLAEEDSRPDSEWVERLRSGCDSETDLPLIAEIRDQPIGLVWGRFPDSEEREKAHLFQMWVDPNFRCRGAGSTLLKLVIEWAAEMGASLLCLGVTCGSPALRLYARAGFEPAGDPSPMRTGSSLMGQPMQLRLNRNAD
jgi:GNAT superfamily N-acetyltransferase